MLMRRMQGLNAWMVLTVLLDKEQSVLRVIKGVLTTMLGEGTINQGKAGKGGKGLTRALAGGLWSMQ
jgi:hypothetical protein